MRGGLPPPAEKPRFTGVPANNEPQALPSSAEGKGAEIRVQKQAAEADRTRVLPVAGHPLRPHNSRPDPRDASRRGPRDAAGGRRQHAGRQASPSGPAPEGGRRAAPRARHPAGEIRERRGGGEGGEEVPAGRGCGGGRRGPLLRSSAAGPLSARWRVGGVEGGEGATPAPSAPAAARAYV